MKILILFLILVLIILVYTINNIYNNINNIIIKVNNLINNYTPRNLSHSGNEILAYIEIDKMFIEIYAQSAGINIEYYNSKIILIPSKYYIDGNIYFPQNFEMECEYPTLSIDNILCVGIPIEEYKITKIYRS